MTEHELLDDLLVLYARGLIAVDLPDDDAPPRFRPTTGLHLPDAAISSGSDVLARVAGNARPPCLQGSGPLGAGGTPARSGGSS